MSATSLGLLALFLVVLLLAAWPVGIWLARLSSGQLPSWVLKSEAPFFRLAGTSAGHSMRWSEYALALLAFNLIGFFAVYLLQRFQGGVAPEPCRAGGHFPRLRLQHGHQLCHQHQLAGLWR